MGIKYSKIMCADEKNKCAYTSPIPYSIYSQNITNKTPQQVQDYVCGLGKSGNIAQCCDPYDPSASDIVQRSNLIKIVRDNNDQYQEFYNCKCSTQECEKKHCIGFKMPTQYEKCRARAIDPKYEINVNEHVSKVLAANTYGNCYQVCAFDK